MADYGVQERPRPSRQENAQAEYAYHLQQAEQPKQVPSELDVRVFDARVGERESPNAAPQVADDPALMAARGAFEAMHSRLSQIVEGEAAVKADPTLTDGAKTLQIADLYTPPRHGNAPTDRVAKVLGEVREAYNTASGRVDRAVKQAMDATDSRELRDRVSAMSSEQREELLRDIRQSGDVKLAAALTAHPSPWASGLSRGEYKELRRFAENKLVPDEVRRRDQLKAAEDQLLKGQDNYLATVTSWEPDPNKVAELRAKQEASKRARAAE
jgi:hypothetical protein